MNTSLRILCALASLSAGYAGAQTAPAQAATVTFVSGNATIVSAQGERRAATNGLVLASGDTVETGKGRMQLRMVDGALMSLQPETTLRLDEYHLATNGGTDEKGYMSLVKGGLRTVSGIIGKARPDNYKLSNAGGPDRHPRYRIHGQFARWPDRGRDRRPRRRVQRLGLPGRGARPVGLHGEHVGPAGGVTPGVGRGAGRNARRRGG